MSKKIALITGITGQDGSYLAEFLLDNKFSWVEISFVDDNTIGNILFLFKISLVLFRSFMLIITEDSFGKKL